MEVRSTEQCGTATAQTAATAEAATVAAATAKSNNKNVSMDFISSSADGTRAAVNMDLSRTTVNDETRPPSKKDESEYRFIYIFLKSFFFVIFDASDFLCICKPHVARDSTCTSFQ